MRLNLTSQISLEQVEERLYKPRNKYEETMLTSYERIPTRHKKGELSFEGVHIFPLYEFYPLLNDNEGVLAHLKEEFIDKISIPGANVHHFEIGTDKDDIPSSWAKYEQKLSELGGFDLCLMGIGQRGTVATNAPGDVLSSSFHLVVLDDTSRNEAISSFNLSDNVPETAVSVGMNEIKAAKRVVLLAWGESKKEILRKVVEEPQDDDIPASIFQTHNRASVYTDLEAADELTRIHTPWRVTWNLPPTRQARTRRACRL